MLKGLLLTWVIYASIILYLVFGQGLLSPSSFPQDLPTADGFTVGFFIALFLFLSCGGLLMGYLGSRLRIRRKRKMFIAGLAYGFLGSLVGAAFVYIMTPSNDWIDTPDGSNPIANFFKMALFGLGMLLAVLAPALVAYIFILEKWTRIDSIRYKREHPQH